MRKATLHPAPRTPDTKELFDRVSRAEAQVESDQDIINGWKKRFSKAEKPSDQDTLQQQLDVFQAQLELDEDELEDAKKGTSSSPRSRPLEPHSAAIREISNRAKTERSGSCADQRARG